MVYSISLLFTQNTYYNRIETLFWKALWRSFRLQSSCPALPGATAVKILLWNLWMTLETGQRTLKTDLGPKVIVSHLSHPFFPLTHSCFTWATRQLVCGERAYIRAILQRSGQRARSLGNPRVECSGSHSWQLKKSVRYWNSEVVSSTALSKEMSILIPFFNRNFFTLSTILITDRFFCWCW